MRIILTSFRDAKSWLGTTCSIARWQPDWSEMPEFPVDIKPIQKISSSLLVLGEWMKPEEYRRRYNLILLAQEEKWKVMKSWESIILTMTREILCLRIILLYVEVAMLRSIKIENIG